MDERRAGSLPWPRKPRSAPIPTPAAAPWPRAPAASRRARRAGFGALAALLVIVAAAWVVPPMLDWNRFRTSIAAIAGAQLGRKVVIGGDVALRLLPEAVLTANDVTVPDQGDGMSARIASLRLEVGLLPLLTGRLVVHDLVLGSPVVTLPWPLPDSIVNPARPQVPHAFAAHVENGTLRAGLAEINGVTAAIHGGPAPTDAPGTAGPVATFGAEGFAAFDGQRWRFTTALGAPDADGVSAVDLALQGQGPAHDTGGAIQGTLANGILQGRLNAAGPDLSLLMPASALAWRAEAPFIATGESLQSAALSLSLGGAPATAGFTLHLASPRRLDAHLSAASLDLDGWSRLLSGKFANFTPPAIPMRLDFSAGRGSLLGGTLGALSGILVFDGAQASVEDVQAVLPGSAHLHFAGKVERGAHGMLTMDGPATLDAPDLHTTLAWLRPLGPPLVDALPASVLHSAHLDGQTLFSPGRLAVKQMAGRLDGAGVSGGFEILFGAHPHLAADMHFDHLAIDDWLSGSGFAPGIRLDTLARTFAPVETEIRLSADTAQWGRQDLKTLLLDAATGAGGLKISRASASLPNISLAISGALAVDGRISGARLHASTPDVAKLAAWLPDRWRGRGAAWHEAGELSAAADGPPNALVVQARVESADLVIEAEQRRDTVSGTSDTTLTLRHPGAPFLLEALGYHGTDAWLGMGSVAVLAHLHATPGSASVSDVALDAAELHLRGHGEVHYSGPSPAVSLDLRADELALPDLKTLSSMVMPLADLPPGWQADIHLAASDLEMALQPMVQDLVADIGLAQHSLFLDVTKARLFGGLLSAQLAVDANQKPVTAALRAELKKASINGPLTGLPLDITTGATDLAVDVSGYAADATPVFTDLSGAAHASLRGVQLTGLSLPLLDRILVAHPQRALVQQALTSGETTGLSGAVDVAIDHGRATLSNASLSSIEGSLSFQGTLDLPVRKVDLTIGVASSLADAGPFSVRLQGTGSEAKLIANPGSAYGASEPTSHKPQMHKPKKTGITREK